MRLPYSIKDGVAHIDVRRNEVLVDEDDLCLFNSLHIGEKRSESYAYRVVYVYSRDSQKTISLPRILIPEVPPGHVRHHVNGNTLDNRRSNLRVVTWAENAQDNYKRRNGHKIWLSGKTRVLSFRIPIDELEYIRGLASDDGGGVASYDVLRAALELYALVQP